MLHFRPFSEEDIALLAGWYKQMYPGVQLSEAELSHQHHSRAQDLLLRTILCRDQIPVGSVVAFRDDAGQRQARLEFYLEPAFTTRELRKALYQSALQSLKPHADALSTRIREDQLQWLSFLEGQGFSEIERQWASTLHLRTLDSRQFQPYLDRAQAGGFHFKTVADLEDSLTTARLLYDLITQELLPDVPFAEPLIIWPFETWLERIWHSPRLNKASWFLVFGAEECIGVSELYKTDDPEVMATGLTAVKRAYRRKGLALSLKLLGIRYAQAHGVTRIQTVNHSINLSMLAINEALGFVKDPAWIRLKKALT